MRSVVLLLMLWGMIFLYSCGNQSDTDTMKDTPSRGTIYVSVDESFRPVIEQQIKMYEASFPGTKIIASYKSEADCFRDLAKDSTRMILVSRGLKPQEQEFFEEKLSYKPFFGVLAYDAVVLLQNQKRADSTFSMERLKQLLSGEEKTTVVMDGKNATSTVRFLQDSILKGAAFGSNVASGKSSKEVLDLVSSNEQIMGFVGFGWIGDVYDKEQTDYLKKIRMTLLQCTVCDDTSLYAMPSQQSITYLYYPLARPLYYILKENAAGLGTGFMNFMSLERGQLIFRRANLAPAKMNLNKRSGKINED